MRLKMLKRGRISLVLALLLLVICPPDSQIATAEDGQAAKQKDAKQSPKAKKSCKGTFSGPLSVASANRLDNPGYQWSYLEDFSKSELNV